MNYSIHEKIYKLILTYIKIHMIFYIYINMGEKLMEDKMIKMKIKRYMLILFILLVLVNISGINAVENNNHTLESVDGNTINTTGNTQDLLLQQNENTNQQDILTQKNNKEILREFDPWNTEITLSLNNTTNFETTGNITINMHLKFVAAIYDGGEFPRHNVTIYENNSIIKKINIGEQNLPEPKEKCSISSRYII